MYLTPDFRHSYQRQVNTPILSVLLPNYYPYPTYSYKPKIVRIYTYIKYLPASTLLATC